MIPLDVLFEKSGLPSYDLPADLERLYGGGLGFEAPRLYANFVSSLDGVVALEGEKHSSQMISGQSEADRFVMGLLRACADAVLIGAGTLRAAPGSVDTDVHLSRRGRWVRGAPQAPRALRRASPGPAHCTRRDRGPPPGAGGGGPGPDDEPRRQGAEESTFSIFDRRGPGGRSSHQPG
jgi:hypothetical protein